MKRLVKRVEYTRRQQGRLMELANPTTALLAFYEGSRRDEETTAWFEN